MHEVLSTRCLNVHFTGLNRIGELKQNAFPRILVNVKEVISGVLNLFLLATHIIVFRNLATLSILKYKTKESYFETI
jgi:hypothetical protein